MKSNEFTFFASYLFYYFSQERYSFFYLYGKMCNGLFRGLGVFV